MPSTPDTPSAEPPIDRSWLADDTPLGAVTPETEEQQLPTAGPVPVTPPPAPAPQDAPIAAPRFALPKVKTPAEVLKDSTIPSEYTQAQPGDIKKANEEVIARYDEVLKCFEGKSIDVKDSKDFQDTVMRYLVLLNATYVTTGMLPRREPEPASNDVPMPAGLSPMLRGLGATRAALQAGVDLIGDDATESG